MIAGMALLACDSKIPNGTCTLEEPATPSYSVYQLEKATFVNTTPVAIDTFTSLNEVSGLAASKVNPHALWAHGDSGSPEIIYLIDTEAGIIKGRYRLNMTENIDWEDIAVGPGPVAGQSYVYLADIGDNQFTRTYIEVYRFPEPIFIEKHRNRIVDYQTTVDTLRFGYPDKAHDAEALMIDPIYLDLYVITKRDAKSIIYLSSFPQSTIEINILDPIVTLPFNEVVAADIHPTGSKILIKSYGKILYWQRDSANPLCETLASTPQEAPYYAEPQGEAVAFGEKGYYTISEYVSYIKPVLYYYSK